MEATAATPTSKDFRSSIGIQRVAQKLWAIQFKFKSYGPFKLLRKIWMQYLRFWVIVPNVTDVRHSKGHF